MGKKIKRVSKAGLVFLRLKNSDQKVVLAGLRWIANNKGYKPGFAAVKFKEIFEKWPDGIEVEPGSPTPDLVSWLASQRRNYGQRRKRQDEKRAEECKFRLGRINAILAEIEAVDSESGGVWRDTGDWEPLCIVERIEKRMVLNGCKGFLESEEIDAPEDEENAIPIS